MPSARGRRKAPPQRRGFFLFLALFLALAAVGAAEPWRKIPWHLVDVWWTLEDAVTFREFSIEVEISGQVDGPVPLYIAPTGLLIVNGIRAYGGLQTHTDFPGKPVERGAIFSRWDERREELARAGPGGLAVSSGSEGDFISVRVPLAWKPGRHRVVVSREESGPEGTWLRYRVCPATGDRCAEVGRLRFPGVELKLGRSFNSFFEVYGKSIKPEDIPAVTVVFRDPRVDGRPVALKQATAYYPGDVPPHARASREGERGVRIEAGRPFDRSGLPTTRKGAFHEKILGTPQPTNQ